jgi:hypothetical protein
MPRFFFDLKFASRSLRRSPMFMAVAVISLALGIGMNRAIFSLLDQLLLRLLPVKNPRELALFTMRAQHYGSNWGYTPTRTRCTAISSTTMLLASRISIAEGLDKKPDCQTYR